MSESFEFRETTHFTAGAVGEPGQRVFYLQLGDLERQVSVKVEKQQVAALAQFLRTLLQDLPAQSDPHPSTEFVEPAVAEWIVGQIAVGVDEADSQIILVVEEIVVEADDDLEDEDDEIAEAIAELLGERTSDGASIRAHVDARLAAEFVATADELIKKGRPPCRLCGLPLDPTGHACPRLN